MIEKRSMIQQIRQELGEHIDDEYRDSAKRFVKEGITLRGVRTPVVRRISGKYYSRVRKMAKEKIVSLCEDLLKSGYSEDRTIAFDWAFRLKKYYTPFDFRILESWLREHVSNWGACDDLCTHAFGAFIYQLPEFIREVMKWTEADSKWLRRASAVVMIYSIRRNEFPEAVVRIADSLLLDEDYLVQKGYGWMLKEASNKHPDEVFNYVTARKKTMPRTALRYAIEKLSPELKSQAMRRQ